MVSKATQIAMRRKFYTMARATSYVVSVKVRLIGETPENGGEHAQEVLDYLESKQEGDTWINRMVGNTRETTVFTTAILDRDRFMSTVRRLTSARWTGLPGKAGVTPVIEVHWSEPVYRKEKPNRQPKKWKYTCPDCGSTTTYGG